MDYKIRGFYIYFYLGIVSKVKVLGRASWYKGVKDKSKSISNNILLGFYCELNFFIIYN